MFWKIAGTLLLAGGAQTVLRHIHSVRRLKHLLQAARAENEAARLRLEALEHYARDTGGDQSDARALRLSEERFRIAAMNAADFLFEAERDSGALRFFGESSQRPGLAGGSLPASVQEWLDLVHADDRARIRSAVLRSASSGAPFQLEYRLPSSQGMRHVLTRANVLESDPNRWIGVVMDITEWKRAEQHLTYQALHDPLTGLPNRRLLDDRLAHAAERAQRENRLIAVLFIDLDDFKQANDSFGHAFGDELLRHIARRLRRTVRRADTLARTGGDEFTLVVENVAEEAAAISVAEKLRRSLAAPFHVSSRTIAVSASIGVSLYPLHGSDQATVQQHADAAMYAAKRGGKNAVHLYRPDSVAP